ncbi:MarR family winged helix-turn-helix transcriptional regulator [Glutamicibacter sp. MNS18]|uniref:MarR family winged helix-turn-helix transcriptional regulator n=1 Tax=Glutamicibacter sp. MNS18 TaxID=2989817 RepID=UPI002236A35B|nr:MarR family winged helix-turn-helix transcriptional regulator [Glutamicibacter sp. MNS18]MCW4466932.1 MarR family winged helix-turn-helix transcriptional regulator [Glutamicibacter sp. MNS18]
MAKNLVPPVREEVLRGISPVFQDVINLTRIGGILSRPFFQTYAQNYSLTLNEWRVVVVVHAMPGVAGLDVSQRTGIHPMNVSRAVSSLREAGRITSEQDPDNHRRQLLHLTAAGEELYQALFPSAQMQAERLFSILDAQEQETFSKILHRLYEHAETLMGETPEGESGYRE